MTTPEARDSLAALLGRAMYDDGCISPPRTHHAEHVADALLAAGVLPPDVLEEDDLDPVLAAWFTARANAIRTVAAYRASPPEYPGQALVPVADLERLGQYVELPKTRAALEAASDRPEPVAPDLRGWQRDLLSFDADGLSLDQVVADMLGVKSVSLRTEQDNDGNSTSEDRRWRVQYFGGTYGGTVFEVLASRDANLSAPPPATPGLRPVELLSVIAEAAVVLDQSGGDQYAMEARYLLRRALRLAGPPPGKLEVRALAETPGEPE